MTRHVLVLNRPDVEIGWQPWSGGYSRRLMVKRLCVQIPGLEFLD